MILLCHGRSWTRKKADHLSSHCTITLAFVRRASSACGHMRNILICRLSRLLHCAARQSPGPLPPLFQTPTFSSSNTLSHQYHGWRTDTFSPLPSPPIFPNPLSFRTHHYRYNPIFTPPQSHQPLIVSPKACKKSSCEWTIVPRRKRWVILTASLFITQVDVTQI